MKICFTLLTLLINSTYAFDSFRINDLVKVDERNLVSLITSEDQDHYLELDCQSFFHGFNYEAAGVKEFIYLDHNACHVLYFEMISKIQNNESVCLHLDFKQKDWALDPDLSSCP